MPRLITFILTPFTILAFMLLPINNAGTNAIKPVSTFSLVNIDTTEATPVIEEFEMIYDSIKLEKFGLKKEAFKYAYTGYKKLLEEGKISKEGVLTICDFSQSSRKKRLYLIDLNDYRLVMNTYVAHGRNSGGEFAKKFSNRPESLQSSLGFYKTKKTYYGGHGLALTLSGLEKDFNDKAERRKIVMHGSDYVGDNYLRYSKYNGRSFGCPAVPMKYTRKLINTIKDGSCLFIYHPSKNYLAGSKILNG